MIYRHLISPSLHIYYVGRRLNMLQKVLYFSIAILYITVLYLIQALLYLSDFAHLPHCAASVIRC